MTKRIATLIIPVLFALFFWIQGGFNSVYLTTDIGRDLSQISNLWIGEKVIWLGPRLSLGFPASPIYYYIFYPALAIGQGNAESLIVFNILIAVFALTIFGWFSIKKYGTKAIFGIVLLGVMPWWTTFAMIPGNGSTYVFWLILALTFLWFELPIIYAAIFLGLSISFHPAACVALPILIYEWMRRGKSVKSAVLGLLALIIPWTPIILFEVITKGFLTRSFLASPSTGPFKFHPGLVNFQNATSYLGINLLLASIALIIIFYFATRRARIWLLITVLLLAVFGMFQELPRYYLLGVSSLLSFIIVIAGIESFNKSILPKIVVILLLISSVILFSPHHPAGRTIEKIQTAVNSYTSSQNLGKDKKIAVVAALGPNASAPQADDYRFFLRVKGYKVLEVVDYKNADVLIEFIESPGFNWKNWSTWEIEQFGKRGEGKEFDTQGIKIITYTK